MFWPDLASCYYSKDVLQWNNDTGISRGSHSCGTLSRFFLIGSELDVLGIGLYDTLFGQASWNLLLDLSKKDAIESNSCYIKLISLQKESIKCPTAMRTPGKPCNGVKFISENLNESTHRLPTVSPNRAILGNNETIIR